MSRYLSFSLISMVILLTAMGGSSVAVAFPQIQSSLNTTLVMAGWVLSINVLVFTAIQPIAGKASDIFGRKRIFMICLGLFMSGSLLSAFAPNIGWLIFARFIQAVGGGGFFPSIAGIVSDMFPEKRQQMIGLLSSLHPIGMILGPNIGGWLTETFGWRSIFWFNIPFCILALAGAAWLLKSAERREKGRLDLVGAGMFSGSLAAFMIALSLIGDVQEGAAWSSIGILAAVSVILMFLFIRRESRVSNPVFDLQILKQKPFMAANIYNFMHGVSTVGITSLLPLYGVTIYGLSTLESGLVLTPRAIGMTITSAVTSMFLMRWGYRRPILIGTIITALVLFFLGVGASSNQLFGLNLTSVAILVVLLMFFGIAGGITQPAANNACIELMPDKVGTIMGIRGMFRMSGSAIGINTATLILHSAGSMAQGFQIIFAGFGLITLLMIPIILAMPSSPRVVKAPAPLE